MRTADYFRERNGRTVWKFKTHTYERPRPVFVSIDERPDLGAEDEPDGLLTLLGLRPG